MDDSAGCRGCVGLAGSLIGLIAGLVTIIGFFFSDADSFLSAAEQFWSATVLNELAPTASSFFAKMSERAAQFAEGSALAPWWTALLVLLAGGILKYLIEWLLLLDLGVEEVLILTIPVAVWIWVFSGTVGMGGIIVFIVAYIVATFVLSTVLETAFEY